MYTSRVAVPVTSPAEARTSVLPVAMAVACPVASTVATEGSAADQATSAPAMTAPCASVTRAS